MELYGISASVPVAFVLAALYVLALRQWVWPVPDARRAFLTYSPLVLALVAAEWVTVRMYGPLRIRQVLGTAYEPAHLALFVFAVPALANVLGLRGERVGWIRLAFIAGACAALALAVVLMHYHVTDALHGVNGDGGAMPPAH